jgi:DNA-binding MarR family transcriptional regulator
MEIEDLIRIRNDIEVIIELSKSEESDASNSIFDSIRDIELLIRRSRDRAFPVGYFSDAAWDILLEIDHAERNGRMYFLTKASADAHIPLTTALRYINRLEKDGFIVRVADCLDKRRSIVALTPLARRALSSVFDHVIKSAEDSDSAAKRWMYRSS